MTPPRVSVIIPTMNEERSIGRVLEEVHATLGSLGWGYEILVVDTNSLDRTVEIARTHGARVVPEPRRGYGRAYMRGFQEAVGEYIATLDADATYPVDALPQMLRMVEEGGYDFVLGDRLSGLDPRAMSLGHRVGNRVLNVAIRMLFGVRLRDSQSGMWTFRRNLLSQLELTSNGMSFSEELKIEVACRGLRLGQVPIHYWPRLGEAKLRSWRDGWENLRFLVWKRFHFGLALRCNLRLRRGPKAI